MLSKLFGGGQNAPSKPVSRSYGIDAVKITAMFMVVVLHILGKSGLLQTDAFSAQYEVAWFLEIAAYCAVNCFALATGYLLVDKKMSCSRIIMLWLQVVFYTVSLTVIVYICLFEQIGVEKFVKGVIKAAFPVATKQYWYFTAYFCLYAFAPFLNRLIHNLSKKEMKILCLTLLVRFSVIPTIFTSDMFGTSSGYSALWLVAMYVFGAYIKLYDPFSNASAVRCGLLYIGCIVATWLSKLVIGETTVKLYGEICNDNFFVAYTSPTIVLSAVALFLMFTRMHFPEKLGRCLAVLSPLSFAVYLIHEEPVVRVYVMPYDKFLTFSEYNPILMVLCILGTAVIVYAVCIIIERIRVSLFDWLKVKRLADAINSRIGSVCDHVKG